MTIYVQTTPRFTADMLSNGALVDPSTITLTITRPSGSQLVYSYGVDPEIVRKSQGEYYIDQFVDEVGIWNIRWSTVNPVISVDGEVVVEDTADTFTIQARDGATPIPDVSIYIMDSRDTIVWNSVTGANGNVEAQLADGSYYAVAQKDGWRFTKTAFTVSGTGTLTMVGVNLLIYPVTPTVQLCRLYGYMVHLTGEASSQTDIIIESLGSRITAFVDTVALGTLRRNVAVIRSKITIRPNSDGFWEVELVQGATVRLTIHDLQMTYVFKVPAQNTLNFRDIRETPGFVSLGTSNNPEGYNRGI